MAIDVNRPPAGPSGALPRTVEDPKLKRTTFGTGLLKGLQITLRHLFSRTVTVQYPAERPALPPRTRGVIALKEENCTVCMLCARECPDWCIYIEGHKEERQPAQPGKRAKKYNVLDRFAIDYALCMFCGICVDVCPYDALFWSPEFEYAEHDITNLTHEMEKLSDWMYTVLPPAPLDDGAKGPEFKVPGAAAKSAAAAGAPSAPPTVPSDRPTRESAQSPTEPPAAAASESAEPAAPPTPSPPESTAQSPSEQPSVAEVQAATPPTPSPPESEKPEGSADEPAAPQKTSADEPAAPQRAETEPEAGGEPQPTEGEDKRGEAELALWKAEGTDMEPEAEGRPPAEGGVSESKGVSVEEAAEIRRKVYEEEMAKGSDPRVAEGRAKAAEFRARKGTKGPG